jgi:hypothetical protein
MAASHLASIPADPGKTVTVEVPRQPCAIRFLGAKIEVNVGGSSYKAEVALFSNHEPCGVLANFKSCEGGGHPAADEEQKEGDEETAENAAFHGGYFTSECGGRHCCDNSIAVPKFWFLSTNQNRDQSSLRDAGAEVRDPPVNGWAIISRSLRDLWRGGDGKHRPTLEGGCMLYRRVVPGHCDGHAPSVGRWLHGGSEG